MTIQTPAICLVAIQLAVITVDAGPSVDLQAELLAIVNDRTAAAEQRIDAEHQLRSIADPRFLKTILVNLGESIESESGFGVSTPQAYAIFPSSGSPEGDAKILPISAQIAYARLRIWDSYAVEGEPEELRQQLLAELFENEMSDFQLVQLIRASRFNWTKDIRERLLAVAIDRERDERTRTQASNMLIELHHDTPRSEFVETRLRLVDAAWEERGSLFSYQVASRIGERDDPRAAILRIDHFESEMATAEMRDHAINMHYIQQFDHDFDITDAGRARRYVPTHEQRKELIRLGQLRRHARETGDDTELRELDERIKEQQRQVLEERMQRIDAWIAENRERLEQEAEEYAEQRRLEREQSEQQFE